MFWLAMALSLLTIRLGRTGLSANNYGKLLKKHLPTITKNTLQPNRGKYNAISLVRKELPCVVSRKNG